MPYRMYQEVVLELEQEQKINNLKSYDQETI